MTEPHPTAAQLYDRYAVARFDDRARAWAAYQTALKLESMEPVPEHIQLAQVWTAWDNAVDVEQVREDWEAWATEAAVLKASEFIRLHDALTEIRSATTNHPKAD